MNKWAGFFTVICVLTVLALYTPVLASDAAVETANMKASLLDKTQALLNAPTGVFDVENANGAIVRLKIKGEADVPTSMRGTRGDRYAREKANRDARAALTRFLGERVVFSEDAVEGVTITERDGQESSDVLETSTRIFNSHSSAILNGLISLLDNIEGEGDRRTCIIVLGWSKKLSDAAGQAKVDMAVNAAPVIVSDKVAAPALVPTPVKQSGNAGSVTRVGNLDDF